MKVSTCKVFDDETVGVSCELADDQTWAKATLYVKNSKTHVVLAGTPRELRGLARFILDGLRKKPCR